MDIYWDAGVFVLKRCLSLPPSLELPTSSIDNNNNAILQFVALIIFIFTASERPNTGSSAAVGSYRPRYHAYFASIRACVHENSAAVGSYPPRYQYFASIPACVHEISIQLHAGLKCSLNFRAQIDVYN